MGCSLVPLPVQVVTMTQGVGYMASLLGFAWYNQIKMTQIASGAEPAALAKAVAPAVP